MCVTEDSLRDDMRIGEETVDGLAVALEGFWLRGIAEVRREYHATMTVIEREGVVHFRTEREDGSYTMRIDGYRLRDEAAATTDKQRSFTNDFDDRIVSGIVDFSIVVEHEWNELL